MLSEIISCPVCETAGGTSTLSPEPANVGIKILSSNGTAAIDCPICGKYSITEEAYADHLRSNAHSITKLTKIVRAVLSHKLRTSQTESNRQGILLSTDYLEEFLSKP